MAVRGDRLRAAGLTGAAIRLTAIAIPLIAICAGIGALIAAAAHVQGGAIGGVVVAGVVLAAVGTYCDRLALSAMAARPVSEVEHPELYRLVRELSKGGRRPVPRLYLSPAEQPNSFAVGRHPRSAAICCTQGLLALLDETELRGVLGHELAHASGRDILPATVSAGLARVITFPTGLARLRPARAGAASSARSGSPARPGAADLGLVEAALMLVLGPVAALVIRLSVARQREYRADAAGALLVGDPVALANTLRKIEFAAAQRALAPSARRTSVSHLMIVSPFHPEGFARLFLTQPPAGERVRRLEALAGYRR